MAWTVSSRRVSATVTAPRAQATGKKRSHSRAEQSHPGMKTVCSPRVATILNARANHRQTPEHQVETAESVASLAAQTPFREQMPDEQVGLRQGCGPG
jgi:hypothetical protein